MYSACRKDRRGRKKQRMNEKAGGSLNCDKLFKGELVIPDMHFAFALRRKKEKKTLLSML